MSSVKPICGYCSKLLKENDKTDPYLVDCSVCGSSHIVHQTCATKLFNDATDSSPELASQIVSRSDFQNTDVKLHCGGCKCKCFYCKKDHTGTF